MKKTAWLLLPLILFLFGIASADFYKYTDENGVTRYTDDLSNVPQDQRPNVQSYEEAESTPDSAPAFTPKSSARSTGKSPQNSAASDDQARALEKRSAELEREYQQLLEDRNKLEKERNNAKTVKETQAYNQKIVDLNDRIRKWEEKRDALNAELEAYNANVSRNTEKDKTE